MEVDKERIVELWRDRLTFEQIAVRMKISVLKVKRQLRKLDLID